ncbi:hypothetical protein ZWY2020_024045 [Hordeum vulgare]|nr:hypothetical protein ZWY2020_024045 [Hordeum vulgare]
MGRPGAEAAKPGDRAPRRGRASPVSPRHHLHLLRPSMGRPGAESSKPGDQAPLLRTPWSSLLPLLTDRYLKQKLLKFFSTYNRTEDS